MSTSEGLLASLPEQKSCVLRDEITVWSGAEWETSGEQPEDRDSNSGSTTEHWVEMSLTMLVS